MTIDYKHELKIWSIYFIIIILSVFIHELGHCIPAWVHGYWAVPTLAKEYMSPNVPVDLRQYISLGRIIGSILVSVIAIFLYITKTYRHNSAVPSSTKWHT